VVFCNLVRVGRLENLVRDRRRLEHGALRLDLLFFLGDALDEEWPGHSTVRRTRPRVPAAVFERLFAHVLAPCVAQGVTAGERPAVDSAPVKAKASRDGVREKQPLEAFTPPRVVTGPLPVVPLPPHPAARRSSPVHRLRRAAARQAKRPAEPGALGAHPATARRVRHKTPDRPTDPDARLSVKPGKARALNDRCRLAVDTATGLIRHVRADRADRLDRVQLPRRLTGLQQRRRTHAPCATCGPVPATPTAPTTPWWKPRA